MRYTNVVRSHAPHIRAGPPSSVQSRRGDLQFIFASARVTPPFTGNAMRKIVPIVRGLLYLFVASSRQEFRMTSSVFIL